MIVELRSGTTQRELSDGLFFVLLEQHLTKEGQEVEVQPPVTLATAEKAQENKRMG